MPMLSCAMWWVEGGSGRLCHAIESATAWIPHVDQGIRGGGTLPLRQDQALIGRWEVRMDAQREYDRFGPWVVEISDDDPVPPLFVSSITRSDPALLRVKIPRDIDRHATSPGADLYEAVVCLYEDDLVVHQRIGREVRTEACRYRDVQSLRVDHDLLLGRLQLSLPGHSFELRYSTVSSVLMTRLVELIRQRYAIADGPMPAGEQLTVSEGELSFSFHRLLRRQLDAGSGMRLVAAQATVGVRSPQMSFTHRLAARLTDQRLLESMHLTDGRELLIIGRGRPFASWWQGNYGDRTSYIPLANIRGALWREDPRHAAIELSLETAGGTSIHVFAAGNPSIASYAAFLAALPVAEPAARAA